MSGIEFYEQAWELRTRVFEAALAEETSLARVLARFDDFEAQHTLVVHNGERFYVKKTVADPITRLEEPVRGVSCGASVPTFAYSSANTGRLIADMTRGCDTVMEVGSGYGRKLFDTWLSGSPKDIRYVGIEPSAHGRAIAERLAALEPNLNFVSVAADHSTFDPALASGGRTLFVTSFSLMYVESISLDFFQAIARIPGEVVCLFIEPIGFQILSDDERARRQFGVARNNGQNLNFFAKFNQAVQQGLLEPVFVGRDLFGVEADVLSLGSIIVAVKR